MLNDIVRYTQKFESEKKWVDQILAEGGDFPNDGKVDNEIRDMVYDINRLPFVSSFCSCSGHFTTREDIFKRVGHRNKKLLILPNEGLGFYFDGYLGLVFNPSSETKGYISAISQIVEKYPNALIDVWKPIIDTDEAKLQDLRFEIKFDNIQKGDPAVISIKEGTERRDNVIRLIGELYQLS